VLRAEAGRSARWYDVLHSHYWLSGQVDWLAADRWDVPLAHTMHTLAKVKNAALAPGDTPEPAGMARSRTSGVGPGRTSSPDAVRRPEVPCRLRTSAAP